MSRLRTPLCPLEGDRVRGLDSQQPPSVDTLLLTAAGHSGQGPRPAGERAQTPSPRLPCCLPLPPWGQSLCFQTLQASPANVELPDHQPLPPSTSPFILSRGSQQGTLPEAALLLY